MTNSSTTGLSSETGGLDACRLTCAEDDREGLKKEYQEYLRSHADTPGSAAYAGTAEIDLRQVPFWTCASGCVTALNTEDVTICADCGRGVCDMEDCRHNLDNDMVLCHKCATFEKAGVKELDSTKLARRRAINRRFLSQLWVKIASDDSNPTEDIPGIIKELLERPEEDLKAMVAENGKTPKDLRKRLQDASPSTPGTHEVKVMTEQKHTRSQSKAGLTSVNSRPVPSESILDLTETLGRREPSSPFCAAIREAKRWLEDRKFDAEAVNLLIVPSRPYNRDSLNDLTASKMKKKEVKDSMTLLALNSLRGGGSTITWHPSGEGPQHFQGNIDGKGANAFADTIQDGTIDMILLTRDIYMNTELLGKFMGHNGPYQVLYSRDKLGDGAIVLPLYGGDIYSHLKGKWTRMDSPIEVALEAHAIVYSAVDIGSSLMRREDTTEQFDGWVLFIPAKSGRGSKAPQPRPLKQRKTDDSSDVATPSTATPSPPPGGPRARGTGGSARK